MGILNLTDHPDYHQIITALERANYRKKDLCFEENNPNSSPDSDLDLSMRVIKSDLNWLSANEKDIAYDMASKHIAEKCGRTAMPEMNRTWTIPACDLHSKFEIMLREPSLTGDNLGLKTWATSFVISKQIGQFGRDYFLHLLGSIGNLKNSIDHIAPQHKIRVLEHFSELICSQVGSGTGLLGMVTAAVWGVSVLLTDLEDIQENLLYNIQMNHDTISKVSNGSVTSQVLDWRIPEKAFSEPKDFELIMAADPLYDDFHSLALANTINFFLKKNSNSRLLLAIPLRDKYTTELSQELKRQLILRNFQSVDVNLILSQDDDRKESKNNSESFHIETTVWRRSEVDITNEASIKI
ncbi:Protein-lysine N-methyltransferase rrg1 [Erysiphe neolycopersici]|uniref:Protein-lysine N-methyltransferase rrg1 n=1 Tax=Erysiphe neolycopersici TaxID=212602 RepID=A0A420H7B6_9PEZI|nr:Protein-lysine N-methyltransferase rrg1 [Erysiphe neolycopersici]